MFERTKISLVLSVILFAVASWALGHYQVPDSSGKMVTLIEAYHHEDLVDGGYRSPLFATRGLFAAI